MFSITNKWLRISLIVIGALPIPLSLLSWIGTLMAFASIGMIQINSLSDVFIAILAITCMLLIGLYPIAYILLVEKSRRYIREGNEKKALKFCLLPITYLTGTAILIGIWVLNAPTM
jgi:hypothetical protein